MCEYCKKENFEDKYTNELYLRFPLMDDFSEEYFDLNKDDSPIQYIRKNDKRYFLITELNNENGDVLSTEIKYCPMCGRRLREWKDMQVVTGINLLFQND